MANLITEAFTGSNGTNVDGFNSFVVKNTAGSAETGLQIQSNKAAKTTNGNCYAYINLGALPVAKYGKVTISRYTGTGLRIIGVLVLGSSNVSTESNFLANSAHVYIYRSDVYYPTTHMWVYDGATLVASVNSGFYATGADILLELTINADGSGEAKATQSGSSKSVTWGARTWTNGTGDYSGFSVGHSGNDGAGQLTRPQFDDFVVDTVGGGGSAFTPKTIII